MKAGRIALEAALDWAMDRPEYDALCIAYAKETGRELTRDELQMIAWYFFEREMANKTRQRREARRPRPGDFLLPIDGDEAWREFAERVNKEYAWLVRGARTAEQMKEAMVTAVGIVKLDMPSDTNGTRAKSRRWLRARGGSNSP